MLNQKVEIIFFCLLSVFLIVEGNVHENNKFTFKVTKNGMRTLFQGLKKHGFKELYKVCI